jgi:ferric iron reductase protein FhuF
MQELLTPKNQITLLINDLFQPDFLHKLMKLIAKQIGITSTVVIASQFAKQYSYHMVIPRLRAFSTKGQFIPITPADNLQIEVKNGHFQLFIQECTHLQKENMEMIREEQRDLLLQHLFALHLTMLWKTLSKVTGVQLDILWENTFIYISGLYKNLLAEQTQAEADFRYINQIATGRWFDLKANPFQHFLDSNFLRKKCCLYFALPSATGCCGNCPLDCPEKT